MARLASAGLTPDSIPAQGQRVVLRNNANLSTGGSATDVTDDVHPALPRAIEAAASRWPAHLRRGRDLRVACSSPLEAQGGGIVEVNAAPRPAHAPGTLVWQAAQRRPAHDRFALCPRRRWPHPGDCRHRHQWQTTTTRLAAHLLHSHGLRVA